MSKGSRGVSAGALCGLTGRNMVSVGGLEHGNGGGPGNRGRAENGVGAYGAVRRESRGCPGTGADVRCNRFRKSAVMKGTEGSTVIALMRGCSGCVMLLGTDEGDRSIGRTVYG